MLIVGCEYMSTLCNSCIVDQNIDVPASLLHVPHRFRDFRWLRQVANERLDAGEFRRQPVETRLVYVQCDESRALRVKAAHDRLPDTIRGAGHQHDSIPETRHTAYHFEPAREERSVCRADIILMSRLCAE